VANHIARITVNGMPLDHIQRNFTLIGHADAKQCETLLRGSLTRIGSRSWSWEMPRAWRMTCERSPRLLFWTFGQPKNQDRKSQSGLVKMGWSGTCPIVPAREGAELPIMVTSAAKPVHANPVYGSYFADPFVWKFDDVYYAIGTGELEATGQAIGKVFPLLQSTDFFQWSFASNALIKPDPALGNHFWAPAVACADGRFYLYYSVGHGDKNHQMRVAMSDSPQGPYKDLGTTLLDPKDCSFAIDPHPFQDDDGRWYFFYARDFLDHSPEARAGTALMAAPMRSMTQLEDEGVPVLRARSDWQRFQSGREMYGRVWDWHTLEGPAVCKHDGRYFCFFSGGRWENETYGVDYGVADRVMGPYSDAGNEEGPRVLRTVPNRVIGPGHNTVVTGPHHETDYIVYHAWDPGMKARRMFLDELLWTPDGPRCHGPTFAEAPIPNR
jgi:GH43 family beta-xylosidase